MPILCRQGTYSSCSSQRSDSSLAIRNVGIDMIGEIKPTASNRHRFILVAIDYFTKWVEAVSYASVTKNVVARFIKQNLICRYGIPERIITDNGINLNNTMITALCKQFQI